MFTASADIYDALYAFRDTRGEAQRAMKLARAALGRPIESVLDVGCATGDHAAHVLRSGVRRVEALDLDGGLLAIARRKYPNLRFHRGDMTSVRLGETFDVVLSFYGVIAYAHTPARLRRFAANVARHLNEGGVAVIEPWHLAGAYRPEPLARHVITEDAAIARASVSALKGSTVRMTVDYLVAHGTRLRHLHEVHRLGLFSREEHLEAFRAAGLAARWSDEGLREDRGVIVALKPRS